MPRANEYDPIGTTMTLVQGVPTDSCEGRVIAEIAKRRRHGLAKYGVTVERTDLTRRQWLQHAKEEALDLAIYLEKLISLEDSLPPRDSDETIDPELR